MIKVIKEERVANTWFNAGITIDEAKAELFDSANPHYVSLDGKAVKVYSSKVLAIMHELSDKPTIDPESKFAVQD